VPFDLSMWKLIALGLIAMVVFGPEKLPEIARDAGRILRQVRGMAQTARAELQTELGDTLGEFDLSELNPKTFVRKHLFEDDEILDPNKPVKYVGGTSSGGEAPASPAWTPPTTGPATAPVAAAVGVAEPAGAPTPAPYDFDAT
jgi:sec-independent protein translocase protein TatB